MEGLTFEQFLANVGEFFGTIGDGIGIFMKPPLVWFVIAGFAAASISIAKGLIPRKRAR